MQPHDRPKCSIPTSWNQKPRIFLLSKLAENHCKISVKTCRGRFLITDRLKALWDMSLPLWKALSLFDPINTISTTPAKPALHTPVSVCLEAGFALRFNSKTQWCVFVRGGVIELSRYRHVVDVLCFMLFPTSPNHWSAGSSIAAASEDSERYFAVNKVKMQTPRWV